MQCTELLEWPVNACRYMWHRALWSINAVCHNAYKQEFDLIMYRQTAIYGIIKYINNIVNMYFPIHNEKDWHLRAPSPPLWFLAHIYLLLMLLLRAVSMIFCAAIYHWQNYTNGYWIIIVYPLWLNQVADTAIYSIITHNQNHLLAIFQDHQDGDIPLIGEVVRIKIFYCLGPEPTL